MTFQIVIPARGGSKRFPGKNTAMLNGLPLIAHSIIYGLNTGLTDKVFVNTDDESIAKIAQNYGANVVFRPYELAQDTTPTVDVLKHQLTWFYDNDIPCDAIVLMQPTNPVRPLPLLSQALRAFETSKRASLATFSTLNKKFGTIRNHKYIPENYVPGQRMQDLEPRYYENGVLYITHVAAINRGTVITEDVYPLVTNHFGDLIDIDEPEDLILAQALINLHSIK